MTRVYVRAHVGLLDDVDYAGLSDAAKGAWHTLNMLQGGQTDEWFKDRRQIAHLLRKEGFDDPAAMVHELDAAGWIVDNPDRVGMVGLKGWHKWQAESRAPYMRKYRAATAAHDTVTLPLRAITTPIPSPPVPDGTEGGAGGTGYREPDPLTVAKAKADIESLLKDVPGRKRRERRDPGS